jgi:hypothetical protein
MPMTKEQQVEVTKLEQQLWVSEPERRRAAMADGHYQVAEEDGIDLDMDELNKALLADGLPPFATLAEVRQAAQKFQTFEAEVALAIMKPPTH